MYMRTELEALQAQKQQKFSSLDKLASDLRWQAIRALGRFVAIMFGLLGFWSLLRGLKRDRMQNRYLDKASTLDIMELLELIKSHNSSDRVQTGLASILSEAHVEKSEVAILLENLKTSIHRIETSDKSRDIKLAAELAFVLERISRRFA